MAALLCFVLAFSAVCLPQLAMLSAKARDSHLTRKLMDRHAAVFQRNSEDLRRFALKHYNGVAAFSGVSQPLSLE
jgi:hypothetical protein